MAQKKRSSRITPTVHRVALSELVIVPQSL